MQRPDPALSPFLPFSRLQGHSLWEVHYCCLCVLIIAQDFTREQSVLDLHFPVILHYHLSIVRVHIEHKQKIQIFFPEPVFWNVLRKGPQIMV